MRSRPAPRGSGTRQTVERGASTAFHRRCPGGAGVSAIGQCWRRDAASEISYRSIPVPNQDCIEPPEGDGWLGRRCCSMTTMMNILSGLFGRCQMSVKAGQCQLALEPPWV
jgi:hypothetical protein